MRKDSRPKQRGGKPGHRPGKRTPPPERTGEYRRYLAKCRDTGRTVTLRMDDGASYSGTIGAYTDEVISLNRGDDIIELRAASIRLIEEP